MKVTLTIAFFVYLSIVLSSKIKTTNLKDKINLHNNFNSQSNLIVKNY